MAATIPSLFLQGSDWAHYHFQMNQKVLTGIPRHKFLFYVRFIRPPYASNLNNPNGADSLSLTSANQSPVSNLGDWKDGISFLVQKVDTPTISPEVEVLNQYNKKRLVQKKVTYEPIRMSIYNTYDERLLSMFVDYFRFYYADPRYNGGVGTPWDTADITAGTFDNGDGVGLGFIPPTVNEASSTDLTALTGQYFSRLEIYQFGAGLITQYDLVNPIITSYNPDDHDYNDTNTPHTTSITVDYEAVIWRHIADPLTSSTLDSYDAGSLMFDPTDAQPINNQIGIEDYPSNPSGNNTDSSGIVSNIFGNGGVSLTPAQQGARDYASNVLTPSAPNGVSFTNALGETYNYNPTYNVNPNAQDQVNFLQTAINNGNTSIISSVLPNAADGATPLQYNINGVVQKSPVTSLQNYNYPDFGTLTDTNINSVVLPGASNNTSTQTSIKSTVLIPSSLSGQAPKYSTSTIQAANSSTFANISPSSPAFDVAIAQAQKLAGTTNPDTVNQIAKVIQTQSNQTYQSPNQVLNSIRPSTKTGQSYTQNGVVPSATTNYIANVNTQAARAINQRRLLTSQIASATPGVLGTNNLSDTVAAEKRKN